MFLRIFRPEPAPFIVGVGRSGNTLLRLMLDAHPDLAIPPETDFLPHLLAITRQSKNLKDHFIQAITNHWRWRDCHVDKKLFIERISKLKSFTITSGIRLFYQMYAERFGKKRWGDKTPYYLSHMTTIQNNLPESHFIHIIRDGRDVALSVKDLWFGPNSIQEIALWWKDLIIQAQEQAKQLTFYREIRYEDLISNSEFVLQDICRFIRLKWNPQLLKFYEGAEKRLTEVITEFRDSADGLIASLPQRHAIHALTMKPPQINRINRWKTEMSIDDQRLFVKIAGDLLEKLNYEITVF